MVELIYTDKSLIVEGTYQVNTILYCEIVNISTNRPYIEIVTIHNKTIYVDGSLSKIIPNLPPYFFRCNQSSIVNLLYVKLYAQPALHTALNKKFTVSAHNFHTCKEKLVWVQKTYTACLDCLFCKSKTVCK
jgi:DNA-binding LytR/AlgR family response regulator